MPNKWYPEQDTVLLRYFNEGLSCDVIASLMQEWCGHPFTHKSIDSRLRHLGVKKVHSRRPAALPKEPKGPKVAKVVKRMPDPKPRTTTPTPKPKAEPRKKPPLWLLSMAMALPESACTIIELTSEKCHFPLWPDNLRADPTYPYCGAPVDTKLDGNKSPYCLNHSRRCYGLAYGK